MESLICDLCHARFSNIEKFTAHKQSLSTFSCSYCDYLFHTPMEVGIHMSLMHGTDEDFEMMQDELFVKGTETRAQDNNIQSKNCYSTDTGQHPSTAEAIDKGGTNVSEAILSDAGEDSDKNTKPLIAFLESESARKQKRKGSHPKKLMKLGSGNAAEPAGDVTIYKCKHCKRTFTKERHYKGHKCMSKGDYVSSTDQVESEEEHLDSEGGDPDFSAEGSEDEGDFKIIPFDQIKKEIEEDDFDVYFHTDYDVSSKGSSKRARKVVSSPKIKSTRRGKPKRKTQLVVVEENTPLELTPQPEVVKKTQNNESSLNKENQPISDAPKPVEGTEDDEVKYNVPVFSTQEERLAAEEELRKVDLSVVDHLFVKRSNDNLPCKFEYSCNICGKVFTKKPKIRRHCLTHTDLKPFRCLQCDESFPAKFKLLSHMRLHTGNLYKCSLCDFTTIYRPHIARHEAAHGCIRPVCKLCKSDFSSMMFLEKHIRKAHANAEGHKYLYMVKAKQKLLFECRICQRKFTNQHNRDKHQRAHGRERKQSFLKRLSGASAEPKDLPKCRLCFHSSKQLTMETHLMKHRLVYVCCICSDVFISAVRLRNHLQEHVEDASKAVALSESQTGDDTVENTVTVSIPEADQPTVSSEVDKQSTSTTDEVVVPADNAVVSSEDNENSLEMSEQISSSTTDLAHEKDVASVEEPEQQSLMEVETAVDKVKSSGEVSTGCHSSQEPSESPEDSLPGSQTVIVADVDSAIAEVIKAVKFSPGVIHYQDTANEQINLGENFSALYVISPDTGVDTLFTESINHSWYIPEPDGTHLAYYHGNIADDLLDTSRDEDNCGSVKEASTVQSLKSNPVENLTPEEMKKIERLSSELRPVIMKHYKPLTENIYKHILDAFGEEECEFCGRRYHTKAVLERHAITHTDDKPFKCDLCSYSSITKACVQRHHEAIHEGKRFPCQECGFSAHSRRALRHHRRKLHTFQGSCPVCEKEIISSDALRSHILSDHPEISRQEMVKLVGSYYQVVSRLGRRSYKCSLCGHIFVNKALFQRHMQVHEDIRPFMCPHCTYCARTRSDLKMHLQTHSAERPFHCKDHNTSYKYRKGLMFHMKMVHDSEMFICDKCDYQTSQKINITRHLEIHRKKTYNCDQCSYTTTSIYYFNRHKESHDGKLIYSCEMCDYNTNDRFYMVKHMETHTGKILFKCELCDYSTPLKTRFWKHQEGHKGKLAFSCDRCDFTTTQKRYLNRHMEIHDAKRFYTCDKCDYNAPLRCLLKRHLETHEEKQVYKCEECYFVTTTKNDFRTHVLTHDGKEVYSCEKCPYTTASKWRLKKHTSIHENKLYNCDKCNFGTNMRLSFKRHVDAHEGKIVFSCYKCDYSSPDQDTLKEHLTTHDDDMIYCCDQCDYTTGQKFCFTKHLENHERKAIFTCEKCDFTTINRNQLRRHIETHDGHMVYACDKCDYSAVDKFDLKRHATMHRMTQQFICEFCDYSCNSLKVIKAHYGRKHKDKVFNITAITANFGNAEENQRIFKCVSCACTFQKVSDLENHIQIRHGLSLESLDFDPEEGIQIEIVTDAEIGGKMTEEAVETNQEMEMIHTQITQGDQESLDVEGSQSKEMDDRTASEVDLIHQIIKQGVIESQLTLQAVDNDGQLVAVDPEAIILQEDGQEVVLDGDYVIQYVSQDSEEAQGSEVTLQEVVLEAGE